MQNRVVWCIKHKNPLRGLTCGWVEEKKAYINKKCCVYFTHLPRSPLGGICIKFCMTGPLADVINCAKFEILSQSGHGFWFCGGSNFWLPHRKEKSPLTQGLNYRSACDLWHTMSLGCCEPSDRKRKRSNTDERFTAEIPWLAMRRIVIRLFTCSSIAFSWLLLLLSCFFLLFCSYSRFLCCCWILFLPTCNIAKLKLQYHCRHFSHCKRFLIKVARNYCNANLLRC